MPGLQNIQNFLYVDKKCDFKILNDSKFFFAGFTKLVLGKTAFFLLKDTIIIGSNLNSLITINDPSLF